MHSFLQGYIGATAIRTWPLATAATFCEIIVIVVAVPCSCPSAAGSIFIILLNLYIRHGLLPMSLETGFRQCVEE